MIITLYFCHIYIYIIIIIITTVIINIIIKMIHYLVYIFVSVFLYFKKTKQNKTEFFGVTSTVHPYKPVRSTMALMKIVSSLR